MESFNSDPDESQIYPNELEQIKTDNTFCTGDADVPSTIVGLIS